MNTPDSKLPEEAQGNQAGETPQPEPSVSEAAPVEPAVPSPVARELPEDLRVPWTWTDLIIFIFFGLGIAIFLRGVAATLLFLIFTLSPHEIEKLATAKTLFVTLHQLLWSATMLLFL